jgi:DHA1 family bicyclomycin/chloramphenicol resistance-like MFS transporter
MLGYVTMGLAVAPMIAPLIGGVSQQLFGWTAIFWLMAALGVMCLGVTWAFVPETNLRPVPELSLRSLLADFRTLLRLPDFLLFTACSSLTSGVFFAFLGGTPYVAERILGLQPSTYGLWFAVIPLGYATGNFLAGRFTERFGVARMILAGSLLALLGVLLLPLLFASFAGPAALFLPMTITTLGNGLALPSSVAGAISVRPEIAGTASGLSGAAQIAAGAIMSAAGGAALAIGNSPMPMFVLMAVAALLALATAVGIYRRNRR